MLIKRKVSYFFTCFFLCLMIFLMFIETYKVRAIDQEQVDPQNYIYSSLLGGTNEEMGWCIVADSQGNIIISGETSSSDFPTLNPIQDYYVNEMDIFVTKFDKDGMLIWSTYYGSTGSDGGACIAVDDNDNIILVGTTTSENFTTTGNAIQTTYGGGLGDMHLMKISSEGDLLYSSFFGGDGYEAPLDLELDSLGNIVITGGTSSSNFPVTENAIQNSLGGIDDIFISIISPNCTELIYSTLFGGNDYEFSQELDVDINDNIYISGRTQSSDFPITENAYQSTMKGSTDIFVVKINSTLQLEYSSYFGGSQEENAFGLDIDSKGNIIIAGRTNSVDFPITEDAFQKQYSGGTSDGFITKFNSNCQQLIFSTFIGGSSYDSPAVVHIINEDAILILGSTESVNYPLVSNLETNSGDLDVVITLLDLDGDILFSTKLDGTDFDTDHCAYFLNSTLYISGQTTSSDFMLSENAYQSEIMGSNDAFLLRFSIVDYLTARGIPFITDNLELKSTLIIIPVIILTLFSNLFVSRKNKRKYCRT